MDPDPVTDEIQGERIAHLAGVQHPDYGASFGFWLFVCLLTWLLAGSPGAS